MNAHRLFSDAWQALPGAQRHRLTWALALALGAALLWLDVLPLIDAVRRGPDRLRGLQVQAGAMQALQAEAAALRLRPRLDTDEASRRLTSSTRELLGATVRVAPRGEGVQVEFTGVPANRLAQWLATLRSDTGATMIQTRLRRDAQRLWSGTVILQPLQPLRP